MKNINVTPDFVLAGEATFTVSNGTNKHYTFKVYKTEPTSEYPNVAWFVKLLVRPEEYSYMGRLAVRTNKQHLPEFKRTGRSRFMDNHPAVTVFKWALRVIWQHHYAGYELPAPNTIQHDGRCGRCGRKLTHPASLDTGLGPECADMSGVEWSERNHDPQLPLSTDPPNVGSDEDRKADEYNEEDAVFFNDTVGYYHGSR